MQPSSPAAGKVTKDNSPTGVSTGNEACIRLEWHAARWLVRKLANVTVRMHIRSDPRVQVGESRRECVAD